MNETGICFYVNQLKKFRAINFSKDWFTVGYVIYKVTYGKELELWHSFSRKDPKYNREKVQAKWESFESLKKYCIPLKKIAEMVIADGGLVYREDHHLFVSNSEERNIILNIIPKLSIKRTRNYSDLNSLASAMYHICNHVSELNTNGEKDMLKVSKRIKDLKLKEYFIYIWTTKTFTVIRGKNDILIWYKEDQHKKMLQTI